MASAGSDDEQPPQRNKYWWCACFPWVSGSPRAVATQEQPQPQPDQQEPRREEAPRADGQDTSRGLGEENPRREPERGVEDQLNTDLQSTKSKGKEKVGEVSASDSSSDQITIDPEQLNTDLQSSKSKGKEKVGEGSDQNIIGVVKNDGPSGVEVDIMRKCVVCRRTTFDFRLHKWSEVCNHLVCDKCIVVTLNSRNPAEGVQIPDEDPVECPVEGCTQMLTAAQCRAYYRATVREAFSFSQPFQFHVPNFSPRSC